MENSQAIAIRVESREDDPKYIKSMDFFILIDGKSDNTLYRMEEGSKSFRKLYSLGKTFAYTVRGNKRKEVQKLVNSIFYTNLPFAMAIIEK